MPTARYVMSLGGIKKKGSIFLEQAQMRGLKVWMVDTPENIAQAPLVANKADRISPLQYANPDDCIAWAKTHIHDDVLTIVALSEYSIEPATAMAHALGLPGNDPHVIRTTRHKDRCRQVLREHGFRQPDSTLCRTLNEALLFADSHMPGPWIVKPPAEGGSKGVSLVREPADWDAALSHLGYQLPAPFVVECFQPGSEFSAEGVFVSGQPYVLVLTAKNTTHAPHFVETGHTMPADLPVPLTQRIKETVASAILAVGLRWGVFHVEFWLDGDQIVLGEIHARSGGDNIHPMTEMVTGVDMYGAVLDQFVSAKIDPDAWNVHRGAAIRYLLVPPGRVTEIAGLDTVKAHPSCIRAECALQVGDECRPVTSSLNRHGFVLATGSTAQEAAQTAEALCQSIRVAVEPVSTEGTPVAVSEES